MRLLRWIIILSSIAYWYSIFAMDAPGLGKRPYEDAAFALLNLEEEYNLWQQTVDPEEHITKKERFEKLPLVDLLASSKANIKHIVMQSTKESTINKAISVADKLLIESEAVNTFSIESIAKAIANKFTTSYLYVIAKLTAPIAKHLFENSLTTIPEENLKMAAFQALKSGIAYNDYSALLRMLSNTFFVSVLSDDPKYKEQLLAFAIDNKKTSAVKALLEKGANATITFEGKLPIERAKFSPDIIELIKFYNPSNTFFRLIKQNTPKNSTPVYYQKLQTLLDLKATINPEEAEINPLLNAASTGNVELVKWLLDHGANPDLRVMKGHEFITPRKVLQGPIPYPNKTQILELLTKPK